MHVLPQLVALQQIGQTEGTFLTDPDGLVDLHFLLQLTHQGVDALVEVMGRDVLQQFDDELQTFRTS